MATHNFPKEEEIQECVIIRKNHGYSLLELKGSVLVKFLPRETKALWPLHWNTSHLPSSCSPIRKMSLVLPLNDTGPHATVCTRDLHKIFECCYINPKQWHFQQIFICLILQNITHVHIIMLMMTDCTRCVSGYGGRRATSTGQEYILLLKDER